MAYASHLRNYAELVLGSTILALACSICWTDSALSNDETPPIGQILAAKTFDYVEDEATKRVIAEVRAVVHRHDGYYHLRLTASAVGPFVDPAPGFSGVRGANVKTARDFERMLASKLLRVQTHNILNQNVVKGSCRGGKRGRLAERTMQPDGAIDMQARSSREHLLELIIDSGPVPPGRYETVVKLKGKPRLIATFEVDQHGASITGFKSVADHDEDDRL